MKRFKHMTSALVCFLAALMLLSGQAFAAGKIDLSKTVSLNISYQDENTPIAGARFNLYLVAGIDEYGRLTTTEEFAQFNVNIQGKNDEAWKAMASTLEGYVLRDRITPTDGGKTNDKGLVSFPSTEKNLTPGLYLVLGRRHSQRGYYYDPTPFMVLLPGLDREANDWVYDVTASPKYDSKPIPSQPGSITRKVLKKWEDNGHEEQRPKEVVVQLLQDGKVYDTVILHSQNDWRYTWSGLSNRYSWTIVEKELEHYTVTVSREGITFVVTNTYMEKEPEDPTPVDPTPTNPTDPSNPTDPTPTDPTDPSNPADPTPTNPTDPSNPTDPTPTNPTDPSNPTDPIPTDPTKPIPADPSNPITPTQPEQPVKPSLPQTGQLWWPVLPLFVAGLLLIVIGLLRRRGGKGA